MYRPATAMALAGLLAAGLCGADGLRAQGQDEQGFGLEANIGASVLTGDDFEGAGTGVDFTAVGSYAWTSGWEVGIAGGFAKHELSLPGDGPSTVDAQLNNVAAVFRKRFYVPTGRTPHVHPYLEARLGWAQLDPDLGESTSGFEGGIGGGAEWWFTYQVGVAGGVNLSYLSLDGSSGLHFVPRAGFKVRFGGG